MNDRLKEIHSKGFDLSAPREFPVEGNIIPETNFSRVKVGLKTLEDAIINLNSYTKMNPRMTKERVTKAIASGDIEFMREASEFFFKVSGIYARLCKHLSNFYRYDWYIVPHVLSDSIKPDKILDGFYKNLFYVDNFKAKQFFGDVALKVMRQGCYYGYKIQDNETTQIQELHPRYCRSRYSIKGKPAVEFNMKFFDDQYKNKETRLKILGMYPRDFQKGYLAYVDGKLPPETVGDSSGWYLLDPECTVKFNINNEDYPPFVSVIPHIMDLEAAQELDRKKMAQKLLKIIIQKMPLDKNGELIFDVDEAQELHNNAVKMLGKAIGIDVLTTFADVEVADMADKSTASTIDELEKVERTVYNEAGTAQNLFNTDGNIALEKSILDDEANMYGFLLQTESFLNDLIKPLNKNPKKVTYKVYMLPTTIYNYKDMSKIYKDNSSAQGGSKLLASIALGQSQSAVLATASFENEILDISTLMSTKAERAERQAKSTTPNSETNTEIKGDVGRKEKPDDQKSEKTIQNREAMG